MKFHRYKHIMYSIGFAVLIIGLASCSSKDDLDLEDAETQEPLPGTKIAYSDPETEIYLGSPAIVILDDQTYIASHSYWGPGTKSSPSIRKSTTIYRSTDRGNTWERLTTIQNQVHSNLFIWENALYIMGTSAGRGDLVIRKSFDGGETWTHPVDANIRTLKV